MNKNTKDTHHEINFNEFISFGQKKNNSGVKRQITICNYATELKFDFREILQAVHNCRIRRNEEFGVINIRNSEYLIKEDNNYITELDTGKEWVRALFGIIGDIPFQRLDDSLSNIEQYIIKGMLKDTFLIEYYQQSGNLCFLTYGGSDKSSKIEQKHAIGFKECLNSELVEFENDTVREICLSFKKELSSLEYFPEGQPDYGDARSATLKAKPKKILKSDAKLIRETLENPKIIINNFEANYILENDFFTKAIKMNFKFSRSGSVTIHVPEVSFQKYLPEIDFENKFYEIIRSVYSKITDWKYTKQNIYQLKDDKMNQILLDI